jgi:ferredoxin
MGNAGFADAAMNRKSDLNKMADLVKFTIDGRELEAPPGTLVIEAAKRAGIEIPSFCYYEGYSLQAACRMCLVEVEKMPKMQVACTLPVARAWWSTPIPNRSACARKSTLEFLLTNHPLDCPVCDKGGECELQDMVFRYGAGESRFTETKMHVDEQQWSPVVFYDGPRCILCFRCVRACDEGMGVGALGRGQSRRGSLIAPNDGDHLNATNAASASISARWARSPAAPIAIRRGPGKWSTSAPSARTAPTAARPPSACATTRSSAATIATAPASTANSSASKAATRSISPITPSACNRP